jgi:hypothetical protein
MLAISTGTVGFRVDGVSTTVFKCRAGYEPLPHMFFLMGRLRQGREPAACTHI